MIRAGLFVAMLACPFAVNAQDAPLDMPRSLAFYQDVSGYSDLGPDRHGTAMRPTHTEFGVQMLVRMFHNVCLGIERGAALADVIPDGFATYAANAYSIADNPAPLAGPTDNIALSVTGSIDTDEQDGHPYFFLRQYDGAMGCTLIWHFDGVASAEQHRQMALMLHSHPSTVLGLLPYSDTYLFQDQYLGNSLQFDRLCDGQWCRFTTNYNLPNGEISLSTRLNITAIQGTRP